MNAPSCAPPELEKSIEHAGIPAEPKLERARADRLDQHESPGGRSGCLGVASSREARGCSRAGARTVDRVTAVPLAKWTVHGSRSPGRWSEVRAPPVRLGRPRSAQPYLSNNFCSTGRKFYRIYSEVRKLRHRKFPRSFKKIHHCSLCSAGAAATCWWAGSLGDGPSRPGSPGDAACAG